MARFAHIVVFAAFLALGVAAPLSFAAEPTPLSKKTRRIRTAVKPKMTQEQEG